MNTVMQTITKMYKSTPSLEETELSKLESLLTQVGGNAASILLKADEISMVEFLDMCIRNGITFALHDSRLKEGDSEKETAPHSRCLTDDNSLCKQPPSDKENSCDSTCGEAEEGSERITLENYLYLSIKVGDKVYIAVSGDDDFEDGVMTTVAKFDNSGDISSFLKLTLDSYVCGKWYYYDKYYHEEYAIDEIYLIRTPEGSLHDK